MTKNYTASFINKSRDKFADKFSYYNTYYVNNKSKLRLNCLLHGEFEVTPKQHFESISGNCPSCKKDLTLNNFIDLIKLKFKDKFTFEKTVYSGSKKDLIITCKEHGDFITKPNNILKSIYGCPSCHLRYKNRYKSKDVESVIKDLNLIHNNKYIYTELNSVKRSEIIEVLCPLHGSFFPTLSSHLLGSGCNSCSQIKNQIKRKRSLKKFIELSNKVHNNKYNYKKSIYINSITPLEIICTIHGSFWQRPDCHYNRRHQCLVCSEHFTRSKKEIQLYNLLLEKESSIVYSYRPDWLLGKELDIFIPDLNLAVEYNGMVYHHSSITDNKFLNTFTKTSCYHKSKYALCKKNGIDLIHIFEFEDFDKWCVLILDYIKNNKEYSISFKNNKRIIKDLTFYGQSFITKIS